MLIYEQMESEQISSSPGNSLFHGLNDLAQEFAMLEKKTPTGIIIEEVFMFISFYNIIRAQ